MNNNELRLSELLRIYIGDKNMSGKALAQETGLTGSTTRDILNGNRDIKSATLALLIYWFLTPIDSKPIEALPKIHKISITQVGVRTEPPRVETTTRPKRHHKRTKPVPDGMLKLVNGHIVRG